jgi:hypothetical protein
MYLKGSGKANGNSGQRRNSKKMKKSTSLAIIGVFSACLMASLPANAEERSGACNLRPADLLATFGYSASGTNLQANQLIPAGPFSQVGTATGTSATRSGNNIVGRWTTTIDQNDSSGHLTTHTFAGDYTVNATTCVGDFSWDSVGVVFRAVFVNYAKEFKSISTLPGIIIAYTGTKL